jgi:photosystem II stability/assembly factor-like uncharacterized protein
MIFSLSSKGKPVFIFLLFCFIAQLGSNITLFARENKKAELRLKEDLFSVSFPTDKEVWACGRFGTILHSDDCGKTWSRQNSQTDYTLSSICFTDNRHGWAVGDEGTIIHTNDGGKTWITQKCPVSYFLMGVYFATPLKGWVVTERTYILHTVDGGASWQVQFKDADFILKSISFADDLNGWAAGEYGFIYHTIDGGMTWKKQAGEFSISEDTGEIMAGNFLFHVFAVSSRSAWAVGIDGYVTRTEDGGNTWKQVNVPVPKVSLYSVAANTKGTISICGDGVFVSSENGAVWRNANLTPPIAYNWLYAISPHGSRTVAVVGGEGAIYVSEAEKHSQHGLKAFTGNMR